MHTLITHRLSFSLLLLPFGLLSLVPIAVSAEDAPRTEVGDAAAEVEGERQSKIHQMTGRAEHLRSSFSLSYSEDGSVRNQSSSISLGVIFDATDIGTIEGVEDFVVHRVRYDRGGVIRPGEASIQQRREMLHQHRRSEQDVSLRRSITLPEWPEGATSLVSLEGEFTAVLAEGPNRVLRLSPISDFLNKRIELTDLEGAHLEVRKASDTELRITLSRDAFEHLMDVEFRNAQGAQIQTRAWGGSSSGQTVTRNYRLSSDMPKDGILIIRLFGKLTTQRVRFQLNDIPLREGVAEDVQTLQLQTEIESEAEPADEPGLPLEFELHTPNPPNQANEL